MGINNLSDGDFDTVDGNQKSGDSPVDMVVYPSIYKVLYMPGGAGVFPSTVFKPSGEYTNSYSDTNMFGGYQNPRSEWVDSLFQF